MDLILNGSTYVQLVQLAFGFLILWIPFNLLRREQRMKLSEPPIVPYKYPIIGHTIDYFKDSKNFINKCHEEYGEIFSLYVLGRVITIVGKGLPPEVFKNHKDFDINEATFEFFPIDYFLRRPRAFFNIPGETVHKVLPGDLKIYMERFHRQLPETIDEVIGDSKVLQPPIKSIRMIAAKLAATSIFGDLSNDKELISLMINITTDDINPFLTIPPILSFVRPTLHKYLLIILFRMSKRFTARRELIKQKIIPIVEKRFHEMKNQGDTYNPPADLIQGFIDIFRDDYDAITDIVIVTIFATLNSTATNTAHCLREFANHPQFQEELLKEQEQLNKNDDGDLLNKIAKMEKLDSFLREVLRVHADFVGLAHKVISSHFTFSNGYQVPKDRFVSINLWGVHSNENSYGLNPNEFDAFRHLKTSALHVDRNFLAFGMGKRTCPGRTLGVNAIKSIVHHILLRYDIKNVDGYGVKPKIIGTRSFASDAGMIFEKKKIK